jgi:hypothetical protein
MYLSKEFVNYLMQKSDAYVQVWVYFFANSNEKGEFESQYSFILSRFKISRSTLQRIVEYGCSWAENGQNLGRIWAGNTLKIIFVTEVVGQDLGRKWAENGQKSQPKKREKKVKIQQPIEDAPLNTKVTPKAKSDKLYPLMIEAYDDFCKSKTSMGAKIDAYQGKCMNSIIQYLSLQIKNKKGELQEDVLKNEVLNAWNFILNNWGRVKGYYAEQIKLSQINSNLPNILMQFKNNKTSNRDEQFAKAYTDIGTISFD